MNLVVTISGRDAIPVRALCFVDDLKRLSPDLVAQAAAGEAHYEGTWTLPTYSLSGGRITELKASHWAYCCRRLKSISSRLKSTWGGADSWDLWRSEATPALPAGVFVWLDEFREWYGRTRPWKVLAHPEDDEQHDNVVKDVIESMERPWDVVDDDLSLVQPTLSESDYCMAMEGFPSASALPAAPTPEPSARAGAEPAPEDAHREKAGVSTDGMVAWQAVMIESWPEIVADYKGKPTARDAMRWLKARGPRDTIPEHQPDHGALAWRDLAGNPQTVSLKTIQNQFSRWKADGKIPA